MRNHDGEGARVGATGVTPSARAIEAIAIAALMLSGCYQSHDGSGVRPPPPTIPDGGRPDRPFMPPPPPPPPPPPGPANAFLIHVLDIPEPRAGQAAGANLDGRDSGEGSVSPSATCEEYNPDFRGLYDGQRGVDDAYGLLVPTIEGILDSGDSIRGRIAEAIAEGELLLLLELSGSARGRVATLHFVVPAGGPLRLDGSGRVEPGQSFFSIETVASGMGVDRGGRAELSMGDLSGPFPPDLIPILPFGRMENVAMSFEITADGLRRGSIGGAITVEDGVEAAARIMPGIEDTARSVLESVADIDPSPADPAVCTRLSVGMTFEAVPAALADI